MLVEIDNKEYEVEIIKKNNRNTYVRVKNGKIVVSTNYLTSKSSILKLINDNKDSIIKMIDNDSKKIDREEKFYYFGKEYDVIYGFQEIEFSDNKIYASDENKLKKYIDKEIVRIYSERMEYYYNKFEERIPVPNLKIRKMTSRWGVCNVLTHIITLNLELIKRDTKYLDYVIVHELSHLIHGDHSDRFWKLVEDNMPDYRKYREEMKEF